MAVLNKHHHGGRVPDGAVNIMRGTPFGNPIAITSERDRGEVVRQFRLYLWQRIEHDQEFAQKVRGLHGRDLCCCCAPLACHGDVLERAAAWLHQTSNQVTAPGSDAPQRPSGRSLDTETAP